ncbi:hypothetical protein D1AOALGA4SA_3570 [Olavius algarvensis Delta 1 endosymbiont]|nr:hypothetical protein D1AOALGA4SA_3570 [Olavius algarvensis Delta 1 endosymbiont]
MIWVITFNSRFQVSGVRCQVSAPPLVWKAASLIYKKI